MLSSQWEKYGPNNETSEIFLQKYAYSTHKTLSIIYKKSYYQIYK